MRLTDFSAIHLPAVEKKSCLLDEHTTDRGLYDAMSYSVKAGGKEYVLITFNGRCFL